MSKNQLRSWRRPDRRASVRWQRGRTTCFAIGLTAMGAGMAATAADLAGVQDIAAGVAMVALLGGGLSGLVADRQTARR